MKTLGPRTTTVALIALALLVAVSLGLNGWLISKTSRNETRIGEVALGATIVVSQAEELQQRLAELIPLVERGLDDAITELESFENATIAFDVAIDQRLPINTSIPFKRTIEVPIRTSIPIDEQIDTTIQVQGPFGLEIPVGVAVPIRLDVPIDLTVPFTIDETVAIDTAFDIVLDVPIAIDVAGTELATLAATLRTGLLSIRDAVGGLG